MSRKVLVVDDEKLIVKGIRFSLEQDGMEVDCAYDGEEAVELTHADPGDDIYLMVDLSHIILITLDEPSLGIAMPLRLAILFTG